MNFICGTTLFSAIRAHLMQDANTSLTLNASVTSAATKTNFSQCPPWPIVPARVRQASTVPDSLCNRVLVLLPHLWFAFILAG